MIHDLFTAMDLPKVDLLSRLTKDGLTTGGQLSRHDNESLDLMGVDKHLIQNNYDTNLLYIMTQLSRHDNEVLDLMGADKNLTPNNYVNVTCYSTLWHNFQGMAMKS